MISRYITLGAILKQFRPEFFLRISHFLGATSGVAEYVVGAFQPLIQSIDPAAGLTLLERFVAGVLTNKQEMVGYFAELAQECRDCGLRFSANTGHQIVQALKEPKPDHAELIRLFDHLEARLREEMAFFVYYAVAEDKQHLATGTNLFGEPVVQAFPTAKEDIDEAGKCLAFDRGTACVFHLMRVLEAGLYAIAGALEVQDIEPNWANAIDQIDKKIRGLPRKTPQEKVDLAFYSDASAYLFNVKEPWRNRSVHSGQMYTEEKAQQIFESVRGFIQVLSTRLTEKHL